MSDIAVLEFETLIGAYEEIKAVKLKGVDTYMAATKADVDGDLFSFDLFKDRREVAGLSSRGAESTPVNLEDSENKVVKMPYVNKSFPIMGDDMANLRQPGSDSKDRAGRAYVMRKMNGIKKTEMRMREKLLWQMFTGTIIEKVDGIALALSMGRTGTHDPDVSATNPWDTVGNNPLDDITGWNALVEEDSGRNLAIAWCNDTVMKALLANTQVQNLIGEGALTERIAQTGTIGRFGGVEWRQYDGKIASGKFIADKYVIFTPDPAVEDDWMAFANGSAVILNDEGKEIEVPSPGAYAYTTQDPVGKKVVVKSCFLPVLTAPDATIYAKVLA